MITMGSFWNKVPILIRAPVMAMVVLMAAVYPTSFLFQMNLEILPELPWSIVPGALYLWLLWRYIGGWGAPANTSTNRLCHRRFNPLPKKGGFWIWVSGATLALTISSYSMVKLLTETGNVQQTVLIDALLPLPATTVLPLLAMMVLMTAFFEEAAFRGYMQGQLEQRYRPAVAIFFTALLFAAMHFPAFAQLPLFVFGSMGWGVLTYLSRTILPAIVMHGIVDGVFFVWVWQNPDKFNALLEHNVLVTGPSILFLTWVAIAVVGTVSTIFGFYTLKKDSADDAAKWGRIHYSPLGKSVSVQMQEQLDCTAESM